ncbi:asparaginase domain-containing protein [Halobacteriovorax sp. GB3]|uniref:asparaginase domain-containing protein n=1 Tax=Halobacteriovorax sp. GB3 TaxID=2719615 RepID=UPI00235F3A1C|nr:asparaginase domain-containing protein [Halobacteriovorax sp. GB3]MDD0852207.1 asparaginase domain-containing protein [Halobacteriovorax sp. GB3]
MLPKNPYPNKDDVIIITTGGTIEKTYDEVEGSLLNRESVVKQMILSRLRLPYTHLNIFSIINKDSLDFTDKDRELLVNTLKVQQEMGLPIVVLHGTDTMSLSAEFVQKEMGIPKVPIVFTGAMRPMGFENSDATQNVTEALLAAKLLSEGIYISFHNRIFTVPGVRKNKLNRTFETF